MWPGLVSTWFPLVWILFETDVFLWVGYELLEVMSEICIAYQSISINIHTKLSHLINNYAPLRHSETRLPDVVIQITASIHFISRFLMVHTLLNFSKKENRNTTINGHLDMCKKKKGFHHILQPLKFWHEGYLEDCTPFLWALLVCACNLKFLSRM